MADGVVFVIDFCRSASRRRRAHGGQGLIHSEAPGFLTAASEELFGEAAFSLSAPRVKAGRAADCILPFF